VVGAASNYSNELKEKITGNCKIPQKQQIMEFGVDISRCGPHGLVQKGPIHRKY